MAGFRLTSFAMLDLFYIQKLECARGPRKLVKASWALMLFIQGISLPRTAVTGLLCSSTFELLLGRRGRAERIDHGWASCC